MKQLDEEFYLQRRLSHNLLYAEKEYEYLIRKQEHLAERKVELEAEIAALKIQLKKFEE